MKTLAAEHIDEHFLEATKARERYDREWTILQRVTLLRAFAVIAIGSMIYGYFARVLETNRDLRAFGVRTAAEESATVAWFLTTHLDEGDFTLSLSRDARLLIDLVGDIGRVHAQPVTVESRFSHQLESLLREARQRPERIVLALPYLGKVTLPIGYSALAFIAVVCSFVMNLFLLFRQIELRAVHLYTAEHLLAVGAPDADEVEFAADFGAGQSIWRTTSREWDGAMRLFDLSTGLSWKRLVQRRFSLLEIASAIVTLATSLVLLGMAWYLSIEPSLRDLDEKLALAFAGVLALATATIFTLGLRLVAKHVFASTEAA